MASYREFPPRSSGGIFVVLAIVAVVAVVLVRFTMTPKPIEPTKIEVHAQPDVILAMKDLSRLETATFHIEKVIELEEQQQKLLGLVEAKDSLLLVAVGDVVAGIDLGKLDDKAIRTDWASRKVKIVLPAPEVFSAHLDNEKTHVYSRNTDTLAHADDQLETEARKSAERSMRQAAIDGGILDHAKAQAERAVHATLRSLGFEQIEISFAR